MGDKLVTAVDHHNQSISYIQALQTCTKQSLETQLRRCLKVQLPYCKHKGHKTKENETCSLHDEPDQITSIMNTNLNN